MKVASFFVGVGGIDLAFENAGFELVYANEIDTYPSETFELNHKIKVDMRSIEDVDGKDVPDCDVILAGFPCQAFSIAGYRKGFEDVRGNLFFDVLRIALKKKPKVIFLENVKNLKGHDSGKTYKIIKESLEANGYYVKERVLNAFKYGDIPQNRERIYIVAFKSKRASEKFKFPDEVTLTTKLSDLIDFNKKVDERYYYTKENCYFYDQLVENVTSKDTVYQWRRQYVRANKSNVCPTLTANMGTGGHNVPIVKTKYGFRKLTPRECFNLQGFPKNYKLPNQANGRLYKQAGNSVVVPVVERIAEKIIKII